MSKPMRVDSKLCSGCGNCVDVCPVGAIRRSGRDGKVRIIQSVCVECGACSRNGFCPSAGALIRPPLSWPRSVRRLFSDPLVVHSGTDVPGRGTEEMKTNDVTGRIRPGQVGVSIDMGRPGLSTAFRDIQTVAMACAAAGGRFEPRNPLTGLMRDPKRGAFVPDVLRERVLSAIIEIEIDEARLANLLAAVEEASRRVDTVLSVGVCARLHSGTSLRSLRTSLKAAGAIPLPNGKINLGLGRRPRGIARGEDG